jgi:tRNA A37 threonylcarbamoyladenosine modification protein TsaB
MHDAVVLVLLTHLPRPRLGVWSKGVWRYQTTSMLTSHTVLFDGLQHSGLDPSTLTDLIVCQGPGSYTGLRTGASMANTLAMVLPGITLWTVTQFQLVTPRLPNPAWVVLSALRQVAYVARLDANHQVSQPQAVDLPQWQPPEPLPLWVHPTMEPHVPQPLQTGYQLIPEGINELDQALQCWQQGVLTPVTHIEPLYIHPPHITPAKK